MKIVIFTLLVCFLSLPFANSKNKKGPNFSLDSVINDEHLLKLSMKMKDFVKQALKPEKSNHQSEPYNSPSDIDPNLDTSIDTYDFMKAVLAENSIKINRKLLVYLTDLPIEPNISVHLAKLAVILNKLGQIQNQNKNSGKKFEADILQVVKTSKSSKELLAQLDKILTKESSDDEIEPTTSENPKSKPSYGDTTALILSFLELLYTRSEDMVNMIIAVLNSSNTLSKETSQVVEMGLRMFPKTPYFSMLLSLVKSSVESIASTDLGLKVIELIPVLAKSDNFTQMVDKLKKESSFDVIQVTRQLQDPGFAGAVLDSSARFTSAAVILFQTLLVDKSKILVLNTMLMSQGLPAVNPKKLIASGLIFLEKVINTFTDWEADFRTFEQILIDHLKEFENSGTTWEKFKDLPRKNRIDVMSDFILKSVGEPVQLLLQTQSHIFEDSENGPVCAEFLLCQINAKTNQGQSTIFQKQFTKGVSLAFAWAWSLDSRLDSSNLNKSVLSGTDFETCSKLYETRDYCKIFDWIKEKVVHTEL